MNTCNRKVSSMGVVLTLGLFGTLVANAAPSEASASPNCHEVTRRVAVWPVTGNPAKGMQVPHFVKRTYLVCNHEKRVSRPA